MVSTLIFIMWSVHFLLAIVTHQMASSYLITTAGFEEAGFYPVKDILKRNNMSVLWILENILSSSVMHLEKCFQKHVLTNDDYKNATHLG